MSNPILLKLQEIDEKLNNLLQKTKITCDDLQTFREILTRYAMLRGRIRFISFNNEEEAWEICEKLLDISEKIPHLLKKFAIACAITEETQ